MKKILSLIVTCVLTIGGIAFAQNTQRTPLQGGATNPTSPDETHGTNTDQNLIKIKSKKKAKGRITAKPVDSTPTTTKSEPETKSNSVP